MSQTCHSEHGLSVFILVHIICDFLQIKKYKEVVI